MPEQTIYAALLERGTTEARDALQRELREALDMTAGLTAGIFKQALRDAYMKGHNDGFVQGVTEATKQQESTREDQP